MERLPFKVDSRLAGVIGVNGGDICVVDGEPGSLPALRCELARPATSAASITLRVHATTGVPLAYSTVDLSQGDRTFETGRLTLLAMEGYAHLGPAERQRVEGRVWSRRAYATASLDSGR